MSKQNKQQQQPQEPKRDANAMRFREATVEAVRAEGSETPTIRMSVSSETPVLTYGHLNGVWQRFYEILDHAETSVDRSRCADGLVIQDTHWGDQIGLIRAPVIAERKLGGVVEFCTGERASEIAQDAAKGLRRNVSVGYRCDPEKYVIEGSRDGVPVARSLRWCPHEASFVNVPADTGVGVGRSLEDNNIPAPSGERGIMNPKQMMEFFQRAARHGIDAETAGKLVEKETAERDLDALIIERQASQITALSAPKKDDPAAGQRATIVPVTPKTDIPEKEMRQYSLLNVVRKMSGGSADIGREIEISEELAKQRGKPASGIIIPHAALCKRDFTVSGTSSATVATNLLAGEFIDLLRSKSILGPLGVRFLTGLVGDVAIPKMSAGASGYWVAESGDITGSAPTLGQVAGSPHTCGVLVDISRKLIMQSTPSAEMMVRDELMERLARTVQLAVFAGTGADGQPSGIKTASGIANPSVTQGTPTFAELLGFPGAIMSNNADGDGMKWCFPAAVWQKLAATFTDGTAKAERVLDYVTKTCLGYPYLVSEDVGAKHAFFGDWSTVAVGVWGNGIDINVDDKTLSKSGGVRIVGLQDVDVMVRLGQKLAYNATVIA